MTVETTRIIHDTNELLVKLSKKNQNYLYILTNISCELGGEKSLLC